MALTLTLLLAGKGWGQPLLVENFDYTIGSPLTSNGWTAHSGAGTQAIDVTDGLTFPGYLSSGIGGAANLDNNGEDVNRTFPEQTTGTIYVAFVIQTQGTNSAGYFLHLGQSTIGTTFFTRIWVNATGNGVGLGANAPSKYIPITAGNATLIVAKYDWASKVSSLYVFNSFPASEPAAADTTFTETASITNVGSIALRQYNAAQRIIVDGIRVATSWDEAVNGVPVWTAEYPKFSNVAPASLDLTFNLNEPGTAYYVILENDATAPTSAEVKAGTASGGGPAVASGSKLIAAASTDYTSSIVGLTPSTSYDIYVVAEDNETTPNLQATPVKIDVTMLDPDNTPPTWTTGYPKLQDIANNDVNIKVSTNEVGKAYYIVVQGDDPSPDPTPEQVKAGQDGSGGAALKSGNINIAAANTEFTSNVNGLTAGTSYKAFIVAEDNVPNLQTAVESIMFTTTSILPEPTNHATAFAVSGVVGSTTATLTWTDAVAGAQAPENYVIVVNTTGTFTVTDGTPIADDTDFSDDAGAINVAYGVQTATFNTLVPGKHYYAQIFPYTNSGAATDYKTDGTVPQVEILTPSITITSPNGGETYYAGDQITITWTSANMDSETLKYEAYVRDYLSSTWAWQEQEPAISNTGSFAFTIPAEATYGTQYKIRLTGNTSGTSDECDAAFTIIASPRIYSIQSENTSGASSWATDSVRIGGIVTAVTSNAKNYYLQAGTGPWSGIYVFYNATHTYQVGDSLIVKGKVEEFNNLTELTTSKAATVVSSANPVPAPAAVSTSAAKAEEYESVLIKVTGATCASGSAGSYVVNDGSGDLTVYKSIFTGLTLEVGRKYDITGVLGWFNTSSIYQLYPRSAADVYAYSNDATLSTFTLGGQDVLALSGIVVANPATDPGATLHVDNFTGFAGIVAAATSAKATFAITLNGATVDPASYATQALADGDVVVATVTAEDGTVKHYKVTLSGENRTLTVTAPAGGESYSTGQPVTITWTSTNITSVNISVYDAISHTFLEQLNTTPVDATLGTFTYTIVNGEFGSIILRISDAADPAFYDESAGSFTVTDIAAPAITARFPVNNATDVAQNFTLSITFDEDVDAGTGNLEIKKTADNSVVLTAAASEVTVNNSTVTLSVTGLDYSTSYYVTLPAGFVVDQCGANGNAAIAANEWTFTTMEEQVSDLFFSEYVEGSSNNKALEIYNPTNSSINLSGYVLKGSSNDATNWENTYTFPDGAAIPAHDVYVIVDDQANAAILAVADWVSTGYECGFNGNDARGLFRVVGTDTTLIDIIGTPNNPDALNYDVAGVTGATAEHTLIRKASVTHGNTDWAASAGTTAENSEWEVHPQDYIANLGTHSTTLSSAAEILTFTLPEQTGAATINSTNGTVSIEVLYGTNATALTPTITVSAGATINPASGVAQNFTSPVTYTVTAQDGTTTKVWTVTVTVASTPSNKADILSFNIPSQISSVIDAQGATVSVVMPAGTNLTSLTPTITVSAGATINPASGVAQDFTNPVTYTVTAQDASTKAWTVTVTVQQVDVVTIHDIQFSEATPADSPYKGQQVTTKGLVTGMKFSATYNNYSFFMQDGVGAWNGVYVYACTFAVAVGDSVQLTATVDEYNTLTELKNVTALTVINSGNQAPAPAEVSVTTAASEPYEGVLVKVTNAECTAAPDSYGAWTVSDGTTPILVDDLYFAYTPTVGEHYNVTGIVDYAYSAWRMYPRETADVSLWNYTPANPFATFSAYPNPFTDVIRFSGSEVNRVTIFSVIGQVVLDQQVNGAELVDTRNLEKGIYLVRFTNNQGKSTTRKLVKQ